MTYKVYCDVVEMDLANILFGRPWLYDREAVHFARAHTYTMVVNGRRHQLSSTKLHVA